MAILSIPLSLPPLSLSFSLSLSLPPSSLSHTHTHTHTPQNGLISNGASIVDQRITVGNSATSQGQTSPHVLFIPGVDGGERRGGVTEVDGHCHEDRLLSVVGHVAVVGGLGPADDGESREERGAVV